MTWEQKIQACQAIGKISLHMRYPGDWYVHHSGVEKSDWQMREGGCVRGASTPEMAVEQHWKWLTSATTEGKHIVARVRGEEIRVNWNGFMWESVLKPGSTT